MSCGCHVCICVAEEKETTDAAAVAVAKYAKNFLPRLFNLVAPVDKDITDACRLAALETLKCYLKICDRQVRVLIGWLSVCWKQNKTYEVNK